MIPPLKGVRSLPPEFIAGAYSPLDPKLLEGRDGAFHPTISAECRSGA